MDRSKLLLDVLSDYAKALPGTYDIERVLSNLMQRVIAVLSLVGSGVTLADGQRPRYVVTVNDVSARLEEVQEESQTGPCLEAVRSGGPVFVRDVAERGAAWTAYIDAAQRLGVGGVAGVPMRLADSAVGALNLYSGGPRDWSEEEIQIASVLADMATGYIVNASTLQQQKQLNEQLQTALESRVIIEQAKGITAQDQDVSVDVAFARIRAHARRHSAPVRGVAEAIVNLGLRI